MQAPKTTQESIDKINTVTQQARDDLVKIFDSANDKYRGSLGSMGAYFTVFVETCFKLCLEFAKEARDNNMINDGNAELHFDGLLEALRQHKKNTLGKRDNEDIH